MKIFFAIQATGNGHVSRAMEVLPYLQNYGAVDVFLSGSNCNLHLKANVSYRSKGLSLFYTGNGGLHYSKIAKNIAPFRLLKEVRDLPVEKYDLVINDFESITALACAYKNVKSINFGHQASFMSSKTPRPAGKNFMGELILKNYARASQYIGLHFDAYDDFILPPVIKKEIWNAAPYNAGHITVYLLSYTDAFVIKQLAGFTNQRFEVFSKEVKTITQIENITLIPVDKDAFNKSLISCEGIITGAGFETPAEALYLQKKIMAIPIKGQYEQACNAAALSNYGVTILNDFNVDFSTHFNKWMNNNEQLKVNYSKDTKAIVGSMMQLALHENMEPTFNLENLVWK